MGDTVKAGQRLGEMDQSTATTGCARRRLVLRRSAATLADATARHAMPPPRHAATNSCLPKATSEELLAARRQDLQLASAALTARHARTRPGPSPTCRRCAPSA